MTSNLLARSKGSFRRARRCNIALNRSGRIFDLLLPMLSGSPGTLLKMLVTVAARSAGPVASGRPWSHKLFRRLQSSIYSRCNCWPTAASVCELCRASKAVTLRSTVVKEASPTVSLVVRV